MPNEAKSLLNRREQQLFERMPPYDQVHSIDVFREIRAVNPEGIDLQVAGLLHDVGKGLPSLAHRVAFVLVVSIWPKKIASWATMPRKTFRGSLWAMSNQAEYGAQFLEAAGSRPRVTEIVRKQGSSQDPDAALLTRIDSQC